jgi:type IX secretion system PorP/SprF family membrane protein
MNLNPALVGESMHPFVTAQHRSQWGTYSNNYPINITSGVYPISEKYSGNINKGGLGLLLAREGAGMQGLLTHTELRFAGAYNLPLDYRQRHVVSLGIATGYQQRTIDLNKIQWGSQYDAELGYQPGRAPSVNIIRDRVGYVSAQAGLVWSYNSFKNTLLNRWQWTSGVAVSHLNQPNISFTDQKLELPTLVTWHGGATYTKYNWKIHPQAIVVWQQSSYHINVGAYMQYRVGRFGAQRPKTLLLGGLWYRWNDAIALSGGLLHRNIQIAFSLDFSHYPAINYTSAGEAWEVSIVYTIAAKKRNSRRRLTPLI